MIATPDEQPLVLYVDDEAQSLKYFDRLIAKERSVLVADNAADARNLILEHGDKIGVIISDQRMPGEQGVDLLSWARQQIPLATRILTTAFSDLDSAIAAVNQGAIFQYLVKPWEVTDLRMAIHRAMEYHVVQRDRDRLLREKMVSLQRLVIMDRVRSCAVVAAALSHRLRYPLHALKTFLESVPTELTDDPPAADGVASWSNLWDLARSESRRMLDLVEEVLTDTAPEEYTFNDELDCGPLFGAEGTNLTVRCNGDEIKKLIELIPTVLGAIRPDGSVQRAIQAREGSDNQLAAVMMDWHIDGGPLTDEEKHRLYQSFSPGNETESATPGLNLLSAYFLTFHHGGTLALDMRSDQPGFRLELPRDPMATSREPIDSGWVDRIFTLFEP